MKNSYTLVLRTKLFMFRHLAEIHQLQDQIESMKELLHTYEQAIERKDQVIQNLTNGVQRQKEKTELAKKFSDWKLHHSDLKREVS